MEIHTHNDAPCVVLQTPDELAALTLAADSLAPAIETRFSKETKNELAQLPNHIDQDGLHMTAEQFAVVRAAARYALYACNVETRSRVATAYPGTRLALESLQQVVVE